MNPERIGSPCPEPGACYADRPASFHNAMLHLYRAEMHRMVTWRTRLDTSTQWAIVLTAGMTSFSLGSADVPHYILLLGLVVTGLFLTVEARRYRHLHHSKWRLHLLEHHYFAEQLRTPSNPYFQYVDRSPEWIDQVAIDLRRPHFTVSWFLAVRIRLRRNYILLYYFLVCVWLTKLFIHPHSPSSFKEWYGRFAMGDLFPSAFVAITALLFVGISSALAAMTPTEESLERWSESKQRQHMKQESLSLMGPPRQ